MKFTCQDVNALGPVGTKEEALRLLESSTDVLVPGDLHPKTIVILDGQEYPIDQIKEITEFERYGKGVIDLGDDQFAPILHLYQATVATVQVDDEDEVREALQVVADAGDDEKAGEVAKLVELLTDNGKDTVEGIADDEDDELNASAKLVQDALEAAKSE